MDAAEDEDFFMREMAALMKTKFDEYWGECNLLMAIASVLDPRVKFHIVDICFSLIYKPEQVAKENIKKARESLEKLYDEYVTLSLEESSSMEVDNGGNNPVSNSSFMSGFDQILSMVREKEAVPPMKSELHVYLVKGIYIINDKNDPFSA